MQRGAMGLLEVTFTAGAIQLAPGTAIGMAIGAEIAPAHPAPIGTVRVRAEVRRGVDLAAAPPRRHEARRRSCGGLRAGIGGVRTGGAVRLGGEARKGFGLTLVLWQEGWELWRRARGRLGAWPRHMEADAD